MNEWIWFSVDASILVLLVIWFVMDRCNLYFRGVEG